MYRYALAVMISAVTPHRRADRRPAGPAFRPMPQDLTDFSDYYLRDFGFVRERTARPRDHVVRM